MKSASKHGIVSQALCSYYTQMIKKITVGTTNQAKVDQIKDLLTPLGIEVKGIDKNLVLPEIEEIGTLEENARNKALTYAKFLNTLVLSMDNGLYLDGLDEARQPGTHVRRVPGISGRPSDDQVLNYLKSLITELGGKATGRFKYAICIANPSGQVWEMTTSPERNYVDIPSNKRIEGYPIESLQIDALTGKYISEMTKEEKADFWIRTLGKDLSSFINSLQSQIWSD